MSLTSLRSVSMTLSTTTFGLDSGAWDAIASIAQVLAAVGALALLYMTWKGSDDTRKAIANSQQLAVATERLAQSSTEQQRLAVLPVIEITFEAHERRFRIINRGNGPLVDPRLEVGGRLLTVVGQIEDKNQFMQVGAVSVDRVLFALFDEKPSSADSLELSGITISGGPFSATLNFERLEAAGQLVAQMKPQ